jgi:predicted histone-like DNA-binding protein
MNMVIKVKVISKKNPKEPEAPPRFYASAVHDVQMDLDMLATEVAERCSLRRADVHGVLIALMDLIPKELSNGKSIALGQLGTFAVNVMSAPAETAEEVSPGLVKGFKILYRSTKKFKKQMSQADVSFVI